MLKENFYKFNYQKVCVFKCLLNHCNFSREEIPLISSHFNYDVLIVVEKNFYLGALQQLLHISNLHAFMFIRERYNGDERRGQKHSNEKKCIMNA